MKLQEIIDHAVANNLGKKEDNIDYLTIECTHEEYKTFAREIQNNTTPYKPMNGVEPIYNLPPGTFYRFQNYNGVYLEIIVNKDLKNWKIR
jgi:hypothetical protein